MAQKKDYRSDNTYMISTDTGDNPKLGAKVLSDGRESLFLDYYLGYTKSISEKSGKEVMKVNVSVPLASTEDTDRAAAEQRNVRTR